MTPERWAQVNEMLHRAMQLAPEKQAAFLDGACGSDESLRREVESSNRNDAACARLAQKWNRRPQNVKCAIQIEIKHALESRVVDVHDRLATGEAANCVRQHIKFSEARHNLIDEGFGAFSGRNLCC